jgi:hypothetical protein
VEGRQGLRIVIEGDRRALTADEVIDRTLAICAVLRHFLPDLRLRIERDPRTDD